VWRWSGADLAEAIATRQVSAGEALDSVLARLHAVDQTVNAVAEVLEAEALAAADAADQAVAAGEDLCFDAGEAVEEAHPMRTPLTRAASPELSCRVIG
jgi:Asp-tRNA(Asn)/Glu-tRNA(Gln) amidotransferase A subunit family amidase